MYVKLENGNVVYCPKELLEEGKRIIGYTDEFLRARGYKPIVFAETSEYSTESCKYVDKGEYIQQVWTN